MKLVIRTVTLVAAAAIATAATTTAAQQDKIEVPDRFASFEMVWPTQKSDIVAVQARTIAEVLSGERLRRPALVVPIKSADGNSRRMQVNVPEVPALEITYLSDYAEFRIVNTELVASTDPEREIPQEEAVKIARRTVEELAARKIVDARHYNWENADVASTWVGGGSIDGKSAEKKRIEYRITVRRSINGIELANAGLRIAVHVSGRVSGLRFGGVAVASKLSGTMEEPIGKGRWIKSNVSAGDLQTRFEREMVPERAKARIAWSRVMYVMPENKRTATVEPLYVVSYSLEVPTDTGETAVSRRKTAGLSLVKLKAPPVDLTPPVRAPSLETMRKKEPR